MPPRDFGEMPKRSGYGANNSSRPSARRTRSPMLYWPPSRRSTVRNEAVFHAQDELVAHFAEALVHFRRPTTPPTEADLSALRDRTEAPRARRRRASNEEALPAVAVLCSESSRRLWISRMDRTTPHSGHGPSGARFAIGGFSRKSGSRIVCASGDCVHGAIVATGSLLPFRLHGSPWCAMPKLLRDRLQEVASHTTMCSGGRSCRAIDRRCA